MSIKTVLLLSSLLLGSQANSSYYKEPTVAFTVQNVSGGYALLQPIYPVKVRVSWAGNPAEWTKGQLKICRLVSPNPPILWECDGVMVRAEQTLYQAQQ